MKAFLTVRKAFCFEPSTKEGKSYVGLAFGEWWRAIVPNHSCIAVRVFQGCSARAQSRGGNK